jgi:hypothetical protein
MMSAIFDASLDDVFAVEPVGPDAIENLKNNSNNNYIMLNVLGQ